MGFFDKLKEGLLKTRKGITERIDQVLVSLGKIDEDLFEELEEILITSDVGIDTTGKIIEGLKKSIKEKRITKPEDVKSLLKEQLKDILRDNPENKDMFFQTPVVIMVIGVNGVGKTTSIGKIANLFKQRGKKVILAAGDTFRAAAIDQLEVWQLP